MDYSNRERNDSFTRGTRAQATLILAGWIALLVAAIAVLTNGTTTPPKGTSGSQLIGWVTSQPLDAGLLALRLGATLACGYLLVLCLVTMATERWSGRSSSEAHRPPRRGFATALHSPRIARLTRQASGVGLVATLTITGVVLTSSPVAADDAVPLPIGAPPADRDDSPGTSAAAGSEPAVMVVLPAGPDDPDVATMVALPASVVAPTESEEPSGPDPDEVAGGKAVMVALPDEAQPDREKPDGPPPPASPTVDLDRTASPNEAPAVGSPPSSVPAADAVTDPAPPSAPAAETAQPAPRDPAVSNDATEIWIIEPGDHLWAVAREHLEDNSGATVADTEVNDYWLRLIDANQDRLADPSNPDLVFVGQELQLPPLAAS